MRLERGREDGALQDLVRYLELEPAADDRGAVTARIAALRRRTLDPSRALAAGLVLPGMGQLYTRRPARGVLVLGLAAGAAYWGLRQETRLEERTGTFVDPFGVERSYQYTAEVSERPNAALGLGVAAAVWAAGAWEAWRHARAPAASGARSVAIEPVVAPLRDGIGVGLTLGRGRR